MDQGTKVLWPLSCMLSTCMRSSANFIGQPIQDTHVHTVLMYVAVLLCTDGDAGMCMAAVIIVCSIPLLSMAN